MRYGVVRLALVDVSVLFVVVVLCLGVITGRLLFVVVFSLVVVGLLVLLDFHTSLLLFLSALTASSE